MVRITFLLFSSRSSRIQADRRSLIYALRLLYLVNERSLLSISGTSSCSITRRGLMTSISLGSPLSASKGWKKVSARCHWLLDQRCEHRLMFVTSFLPSSHRCGSFLFAGMYTLLARFSVTITHGSLPSQTGPTVAIANRYRMEVALCRRCQVGRVRSGIG